MPKVSQTELAKMIGLSQSYISRLIKKGILPVDERGKIDSELAMIALRENLDPATRRKRLRPLTRAGGQAGQSAGQGKDQCQAGQGDEEERISFLEARRRNEVYRAELAKIELEKTKGNLLDAEETKSAIITICRAARDAFLSISSRIGPLLAAETDQFKVNQLLEGEILSILETLESDFGKKSLL